MKIGENIKELRKAHGVTQEQLAEKLGISFQAVSKWENNIAFPDITFIPAIAEFFGVTIDYLFDISDKVIEKNKYEVQVIKPETYQDGKKIADLLTEDKTVIVNFDETDAELIRKLLDFLTGVAFALKGEINRVSEKTFIVTPPNPSTSPEQSRPHAASEDARK